MKVKENTNPETGIRYGYIPADAIDPDVVDSLMYGNGDDLHFIRYMAELEKMHGEEFDEDRAAQDYNCEEPVVSGTYDEVEYQSSWMGGALHFFIFKSPVITPCALCSPCVPNAGDLTSEGDVMAYGVPKDWRVER